MEQKTMAIILIIIVFLSIPNFFANVGAVVDLSKYTKLNASCGNDGQPVCGLENISYVCKDNYTYSMECDDNGCSSDTGLCVGGIKPKVIVDLSKYRKLSADCANWNNGQPGCYGQTSWVCKEDYWYLMDCEYKTEGTLALVDPCNIKNGTCHWGPKPKISVDLSTYAKIGAGCSNWNDGQPGCYQSDSWVCKNDNWYLQKCAKGCYDSTNGTCVGGAKPKVIIDLTKYDQIGSGCSNWNIGEPGCFEENSWVCKDDIWHLQKCAKGCYDSTNGTCVGGVKPEIDVDLTGYTTLSRSCDSVGTFKCSEFFSTFCNEDEIEYIFDCGIDGCDSKTGKCYPQNKALSEYMRFSNDKGCFGGKVPIESFKCGSKGDSSWYCDKYNYTYYLACDSDGCDTFTGKCN